MVDITHVLSEKYKGMEWSLNGDPSTEEEFTANFTLHKANGVEEPTWTKLQEYLTTMQAEYDTKEYQRDRAEAYPSWQDQLDKIYHDGVTKWKSEMIDPIKDAHPKP